MERFSISDIESITGIKAHTIRIWEQRYHFFAPKRSESNIRYYDDEDLRLFLNIAALNQSGVKISKISKMNTDEIFSSVKQLDQNHHNSSLHLQMLTNAMMEMDDETFETTLTGIVCHFGLEDAMQEIIFPLMRKIGMMWQVGTISPAHEHFATHKIQQKIIEATYKIPLKTSVNAKKFVLFLPPQEQHEIGLLFAQYLIRKHKQHCLYLGQSLPYDTLKEVIDFYKPDVVFTSLTNSLSDNTADTVISNIKNSIGDVSLFVTGSQTLKAQLQEGKNISILKDISSFINVLTKQ